MKKTNFLGPSYGGIAVILIISIYKSCAQCQSNGCISDFSQQDCPPGTYLQDNKTANGCCPGCVEFEGLGQACFGIVRVCAPGLICSGGFCIADTSSCLHFQHIDVIFPPTCLRDGTYAPVQCKGDRIIGRCFCSDSEGKRIFGMQWRSHADDMTCACSRRRSELESTERFSTLHCQVDGSYEPLQCDGGLCWCVEPKTGEVESTIVPEQMMEMLPCYEKVFVGSQYLRQCESIIIAQTRIYEEQENHGTIFINDENTFCDYDGTYANYQILGGSAFCTWRNGSRIFSYQSNAGAGLATTDCYCARDSVVYQEYGLTFTMGCAGNGNYQPMQQAGGRHYCVDKDGFPTTDLADFGQEITCPPHY